MTKNNSFKKKTLSLFLVFALALGVLPMNLVQAADEMNYAKEEAKIQDFSKDERYRSTQMEQGNGPVGSYKPTDKEDKFVDGYRYKTLEPGVTSPDKTKWGYEIEFNKEKGQRTYTDFAFTNSGLLGGVLSTGNIPAKSPDDVALGDSFKKPNYKATTEIKITASRTQRNLNANATEEDLKYINNINNNNIIMAWEGRYLKDHTTAPFATQGGSAGFSFTVNPWPNENDKLSLITLSGSHDEKVFVNGQIFTTEVSVKNLDASARERLVGQVYHPETGQVVPGARAYINDQDKVVIEMPEGAVNTDGTVNKDSIFYKDKNYNSLQSLKVKFFARPRTADEFRSVIASDGSNYGTYTETGAGTVTINHKGKDVVIDKQGIARYDHYNFVGEFSINLDDTKYHDQDYIDEDGVKTSTSEVSYVRAGIPYIIKNNIQESTGDITDAVDRKHASASLDTSFLDRYNKGKEPEDQWKIEGNKSLTEIKITPPKNAKALDYMPFSIKYTYTNGSVDVHKFSLIVKESENNIPQYYSQVLYPTETETSIPHLSIEAKDQEKRKPIKYTIEEKTYTDDHGNEWTASINSETGIVTVKPKVAKDFIGGEKLVVPVTAHYVEEGNAEIKFTEEVRAAFIIKQKENLPPRYDAKNGKAGETLTSTPIVKQDGGIDTRTPASYSIDNTEYTDNKGNTWTVSIDEKTGVVTANIPNIKEGDKLDGTIISVPVTAHYLEDGQDVGTKEAMAQFLASGTNNIIEHKEDIPFKYDVEYDPNFYTNYPDATDNYKIVEEGKAGSKTTRYTIENSKIVKTEVIEKTDSVNGVIKVGQKDGLFEYTDKEVIPYDTTVTVNPNLAPNEIKEITKGETGLKERTVKQKFTNGEKGELVIGEYETTKEPVNRVIEVGSNTKGQYNETEQIPFEVEVRKDSSIPKGEWKYAVVDGVQQTGESGIRERTITIVNSKVTEKTEFVTTKKPKNAVILVGDEDFTGTLEYVDKDPVPFETEVTIDTNLKPNEIVEDQAGVLGEKQTPVTREIKNGDAGEEVRGETTQTKDPVNRKIRIGAKSNGSHEIKEVVEVPFETVIEFDDNLKPGEQEVNQEGIPGEKTRTTTLTIENGKVINTEEGEFTQTKAPTKKIIKVGRNTEGEVKHVEELPFKYTVNEVNTLKKGEYEIVKPGKVGTKTTTWTIKNSEVVGKPKEVIVESEDAIINVGMGTNTGTHEVVEKVPVPFETIIEFDDNLAPGEQKVIEEGKLGEKTRTNTLTIEDGKVTETKEGEYEQNIAPINRVIKVARNTNGKIEHKEELPFKYTIQYDPELEAGKYVEETPGKVGERITTWTIENSKVVEGPKTLETKPVDAVIKVGSKDFTGTFTTTKTEPVEYETEYIVDNSLEPGTTKIEQEGELGEKETTVTHTIKNGEVIESKDGETRQTKAPVKKVVKVGSAKTDGTYTYTSKKPFKVEVRVNSELKKGEHNIVQKGVEGEEEITITIENSKVTNTSEPKETKAPVNEIIEVGSQDFTGTHEAKKTQVIEYETEYVVDETLEPGTTEVEQEGSLGEETITVTHTIVNGEITKSEEGDPVQTKAPVNRIVKVGPAKTDGTHEYTNKIPYEVEIRINPELKKGETNTIQKGEAGEEKYTLTIENSEVTKTTDPVITKEAKPEIIEVGSEDYTGEFEYVDKEVIPFETEVKINPNLAPNEIKEITPGENGSMERKVTQKYTNGEKGELVVGEYVTTKESITRVIEVGSKTDGQYKDTETIPFEIEVKIDPSLKKGEWKYAEIDGVQQTGKNGTRERMITIVNSRVTEESEFKTTTEPKNAVILVGNEDFTGEVIHTEDFDIPFEVEVRYSDDLPAGTSKEVQKGVKGSYTIEYKQAIKNGSIDGEMTKTEISRTEPVKHIIEVGRKVETPDNNYSKDVQVEIEYVYDDTKDKGVVETGELIPGKVETKVVNKYNPETGEIEPVTEEVVTPAKQKIIVGTKDLSGTYEYEVTTEMPFEVEVLEDDTLEKGRSEVEQEGKPGSKTTKYEQNIINGKPDGEAKVLKETIIEEPTKHIIHVGTKSVEGKVILETEIPFEVEIIEDPELEAGKTETRQEGKVGKKVTTVTIDNNQEQSREETIEKDPVKKIVAVGTKNVCEIPPIDPENPEDPTDPEVTDPTDPETTDPTDPEVTEPTDPETPGEEEPTDPEVTKPTDPEASGTEKPDKPGSEKPSESSKNPKGTEPKQNNVGKTGAALSAYPVLGLVLVAGAALISKKKKED